MKKRSVSERGESCVIEQKKTNKKKTNKKKTNKKKMNIFLYEQVRLIKIRYFHQSIF